MYTDIYSQFHQDVIETFHEYVTVKNQLVSRNNNDIRKGLEAAVSLYHFGEYYANHSGRDFNKDVRQSLIKLCPDYLILEGITNVRKHAKINRKNPQVLSHSDIIELRIATFFEDAIGIYKNAEKSVEIRLVDGKRESYMIY